MPAVQHIEQIEAFVANYWDRVQRTLLEVFGWTWEKSDSRIREATKDLDELESDARIVFYHAEPYDVAEDFAREIMDPLKESELIEHRANWTKRYEKTLP